MIMEHLFLFINLKKVISNIKVDTVIACNMISVYSKSLF